jgi:hypothetical protein
MGKLVIALVIAAVLIPFAGAKGGNPVVAFFSGIVLAFLAIMFGLLWLRAPTPTATSSAPPALTSKSSPQPTITGPCRTPNDRAADGSRCGARAASERRGGR